MPSLDKEIQALIKAHSPYFEPLDNGKVKCTLNGHEFAPRKVVIEAFVNGKKYQLLKRRKEAELNLTQYEPFLSQSINFPALLFCSLTNQLIDKRKERIETHVGGKRYANAKARYDAQELELWVEPSLEEMDEMEAELMEEAEEDLIGEFLEDELEEGESGDELIEDMLIEEDSEEVEVPAVVVEKGKKKKKAAPAPAPAKKQAAAGKNNEKAKSAAKQNGASKGKKKQGNGASAAAEEKKRPAKKLRK
ncbi:hypothetical protein Ndes2526B_g05058 [Nannochloris sp. 'desiccata']|nr:hypothetical protein KSW81_006219 [Chlorella desiccata (nom. nud.)]KAH7619801.1 putative Surfeit locus protein 2 [Chlorella desiccata (nom. nud.)]